MLILKVNDFIVQGKIFVNEKWTAFSIFDINFVKVQFEAKVLEICTDFIQCCLVVIFKVLYCSSSLNKSEVLIY